MNARGVERLGARRASSLRRLIFSLALGIPVALGLLFVTLVRFNDRLLEELETAADVYVEEYRIADRANQAVVRQLLAASEPVMGPDARAAFDAAGQAAYLEIQDYLFRDLSAEQRDQLERVKERHQRLGIAAGRAFEIAAMGDAAGTAEARLAVLEHASLLLDEIGRFLRMREQQLEQLRARQETVVRAIDYAAVAFGIALLLAGLGLARMLYGRFAVPLGELAETARRIGRGEMDARVPVRREDEFGAVAGRFNEMAASLSEAQADLERRNRQLEETMAELRGAQADLVQREKLSAMGAMMAGLAHELNNPLAAVLGYSQLLEDDLSAGRPPDSSEMLDEYVRPIVSESARARDLVRSMLMFSRKSTPRLSAVPLLEALDVVVRLREFAFRQAGLSLELDGVPDVAVLAESQRLQQVFLNLVNNALEAMQEAGATGDADHVGSGADTAAEESERPGESADGTRGALRIRGRLEHADGGRHRVVLTFEDDGPGLEHPERVFEPFYTTKPVGQGTGLGLALTHRFVTEFGGAISAASAPGGGARFTLRLELAEPHETDAPAGGDAEAQRRVEGRHILVVEDEAPLRSLQRRLLERRGAVVHTAAGGHEAQRLLERESIDLVVTDVKMAGGDGIELFHWLETHVPTLADSLIFVSGDLAEPDVAALLRNRPERFIRKPFQVGEYLERVAECLGDPAMGERA